MIVRALRAAGVDSDVLEPGRTAEEVDEHIARWMRDANILKAEAAFVVSQGIPPGKFSHPFFFQQALKRAGLKPSDFGIAVPGEPYAPKTQQEIIRQLAGALSNPTLRRHLLEQHPEPVPYSPIDQGASRCVISTAAWAADTRSR